MDVASLVLWPLRIPQALDDLAALAERARRDPDPFEVAARKVDVVLVQLDALITVAREVAGVAEEIVVGGGELTDTARDGYPECPLTHVHVVRRLLASAAVAVPSLVAHMHRPYMGSAAR